jgi:hypothetical protein
MYSGRVIPSRCRRTLMSMRLVETPQQKTGEPGSFFRFALSLNLDGPPDWSERFDEYLEEARSPSETDSPDDDDPQGRIGS